ncbi:hypothetical protein BD779DRAFT_797304 [Infundibulicybe gibba]|nr:hypothetical protein BD779DRAFT_797304 [Infundibulicybe gibba]
MALLASLTSLETLALMISYSIDTENVVITASHPSPPKFRNLLLSCVHTSPELRWLTCQTPVHSLTTLHLGFFNEATIPGIVDYLHQASSIHHLTIDFQGMRYQVYEMLESQFMDRVDARSQHSLQSIRVVASRAVEIVCRLLSQLSSYHLEEIAISTTWVSHDVSHPWAELFNLLMTPALGGLRRLKANNNLMQQILQVFPADGLSRDILQTLPPGQRHGSRVFEFQER